jgi:hypothetical protein
MKKFSLLVVVILSPGTLFSHHPALKHPHIFTLPFWRKTKFYVHKQQEIRDKNYYIYCMLWFQETTGAFVQTAQARLAAVHRSISAAAQISLSSNLKSYIFSTFKDIHIFFNLYPANVDFWVSS